MSRVIILGHLNFCVAMVLKHIIRWPAFICTNRKYLTTTITTTTATTTTVVAITEQNTTCITIIHK